MDIFELLKGSEGVYVEITPDGEVLNPFSTLVLEFKKGGEVLKRIETLLKCDLLEGCLFCFSRDYTMVTLQKGQERLSLRAVWKSLTWQGRPIFEDRFFERAFVGERFIGIRGRYRMIRNYRSLEIWQGEEVFRVVFDEKDEFFVKELEEK